MPKEYEYHEGKQAQEDFEEGMKALSQVPKDATNGKKKFARSGSSDIAISSEGGQAFMPAVSARPFPA